MTFPIAAVALPTKGIRAYLNKRSATHTHRGIDLPAPTGTPVYAADDGVVEFATDAWRRGFGGYGRVVVIRHDKVWTLYAHLDSVNVEAGETVREGAKVGEVGVSKFTNSNKTANFSSSRAHLHFEVAPKKYPMGSEAKRLDPVAWLEGRGLPLPDSDEVKRRAKRAADDGDGGAFVALVAILGGVMWLRRKRGA